MVPYALTRLWCRSSCLTSALLGRSGVRHRRPTGQIWGYAGYPMVRWERPFLTVLSRLMAEPHRERDTCTAIVNVREHGWRRSPKIHLSRLTAYPLYENTPFRRAVHAHDLISPLEGDATHATYFPASVQLHPFCTLMGTPDLTPSCQPYTCTGEYEHAYRDTKGFSKTFSATGILHARACFEKISERLCNRGPPTLSKMERLWDRGVRQHEKFSVISHRCQITPDPSQWLYAILGLLK